jgi:hypothetical protein
MRGIQHLKWRVMTQQTGVNIKSNIKSNIKNTTESKTKMTSLRKRKNQKEWDKRLTTLKETIQYHMDNLPTKEVYLEHLFYTSLLHHTTS